MLTRNALQIISALSIAMSVAVSSQGAHAATLLAGATISSPTFQADFSTFNTAIPNNTSFSQSGITLLYVSKVNTLITPGIRGSDQSWFPNGSGTGYTRITLTSGQDFSEFQFGADTGALQPLPGVFDLFLDGAFVQTGAFAVNRETFTYYTLTGGGFDEIRLREPFQGSPTRDALILDNLGATAAIGAVPEPSTWAMMLGGFGAIGCAMRRRKNTAVCA